MVATATDAAVVMLQYEQPIRTGHFLIKRKKQQQQTLKTIQDSQLDFSGHLLLNDKPLLLPTGRHWFKET